MTLTTESNKLLSGLLPFKLKWAIMWRTFANCRCSITKSYQAGVCETARAAKGCGPWVLLLSQISSDFTVEADAASSTSVFDKQTKKQTINLY